MNSVDVNQMGTLEDVKLWYVMKVLWFYDGNKEKTRRHLGIARSTLYRYIDQLKEIEEDWNKKRGVESVPGVI